MIDLTQKSIVVTGGASGIGAAICDSANREGAHVGIIDINEKAARAFCDHPLSILRHFPRSHPHKWLGAYEESRSRHDRSTPRLLRARYCHNLQ